MRGPRAVPLRTRTLPKPCVLLLLSLLLDRIRPQGSPGPMSCYRVELSGNLNCSWEPLGDSGTPSTLYFQSQKYHRNRTQVVAVPTGQSWVTIPREQFTEFDILLIWGAKAGGPLWPPVSVDLKTRVKLGAPWLYPDVDFSEDEPLETNVRWDLPTKLPHPEDMVCQFYYRKCQDKAWILLEPELESVRPAPIKIHDLELATGYEMSGRCRMQVEEDLWGEWSPILSFQTPPSAPKVWVSGHLCGPSNGQEALLMWKAPGPCVQLSYRVQLCIHGQRRQWEGPCCNFSIPAQAEWVTVAALNAINDVFTNLSLACSGSAPHYVSVSSTSEGKLLVNWQQGAGESWEHVVDWTQDRDTPRNLSWIWLPPGNLSVLLPGPFEKGVPYQITVTTVSPLGLAPAPSVWGFIEELEPLMGPELRRLQDAPSGAPTITWGEVPRHQLRGYLTYYTLCAQSETRSPSCRNVSAGTRNVTLPNLYPGTWKLWVRASTRAGQGPPGPSIQLHFPDNTEKWKVLPVVILLWVLFPVIFILATSERCVHLWHKVLPHWVWDKIPDPANSNSSQTHIEEGPQAQTLRDVPILEVQEIESPKPNAESPPPPATLDSGYEKHFLPTPEELGLLGPPRPQALSEPADHVPGVLTSAGDEPC
ncbi:PREDICTED: interleukin-27 receptor subunit alpha [Elephantulus edwardii]|uniref:interleukin-27 receptor subunit alpha n=1 Tax=Elephantulus edwardii TaxID=28737 RepID=UPI0003F0D5E9|nr:PREDICTED: interleukin-27 receptor subunit alpha [Elephantulus edwardii]